VEEYSVEDYSAEEIELGLVEIIRLWGCSAKQSKVLWIQYHIWEVEVEDSTEETTEASIKINTDTIEYAIANYSLPSKDKWVVPVG